MPETLTDINTAKQLIKQHTSILQTEEISVENSLNRVSAKNVEATINQQPFNNSAMDGFAIKSKEVISASLSNKLHLKIENVIKAGDAYNTSKTITNVAVRIMTGAKMPEGFDVVIPFEESVVVNNNILEVTKPYKSFFNVRKKGEDFKKGDILVKENTVISNYHIMLLKASGINKLKVYKKPKVGVLTTGTEFNSSYENLKEGMIYNTNSLFLKNFLNNIGFEVIDLGNIADNEEDFKNLLKVILNSNLNIIVSSGAVSKGDFDIIPKILVNYGSIIYHNLSIRPGKPNLLAKLTNNTLWFGLPGNPVSTALAARMFVYYYYLCCNNLKDVEPIDAFLTTNITKKPNFTMFYRGILEYKNGKVFVNLVEKQGSHIVSSLSVANVYVEFPKGKTNFNINDLVKVYLL